MIRKILVVALSLVGPFTSGRVAFAQEQNRAARSDQEESVPTQRIHILTEYKFIFVEPVPGLRAKFIVYDQDLRPLLRLSESALRAKFDQTKSHLPKLNERFRKEGRKSDQSAETIRKQIEDTKHSLVTAFEALRERGLATSGHSDEVFSVAMSWPSIVIEGQTDLSHERSALTNFAAALAPSFRQPVADTTTGVALGFLEAEPAVEAIEAEPEIPIVIKRSFVPATVGQSSSNTSRVYEIALRGYPDSLDHAAVQAKPEAQPIAVQGQLMGRDWVWQITPDKKFRKASLSFTAELRSYDDERARRENKPSRTESIKVPLSRVELKNKPPHLLKDILSVLKDLFGIVGGIPSIIVAWIGILKIRKRSLRDKPRGSTEKPAFRLKDSENTPL